MNRSLVAAIAVLCITYASSYKSPDTAEYTCSSGAGQPCPVSPGVTLNKFLCEKLMKCCYDDEGGVKKCYARGTPAVNIKSTGVDPPPQYDPVTGFPIDPATGLPYNPQTGQFVYPSGSNPQPYNPAQPAQPYNPAPPPQPYNPPQPGGCTHNPQTGQPWAYNSQTGQYYDPQTAFPIDPQTCYPIDPQTGQIYYGFQTQPPQPQPSYQPPVYQPPGGQSQPGGITYQQPQPYQPPPGQQFPQQPAPQQPAPQQPGLSPNMENLLSSLGLPSNPLPPVIPGGGALGTAVAAPAPPSPPVTTIQPPSGGGGGGDIFNVLGFSRCSVVNSIENEQTKASLLQSFNCTGNEPKVPKEKADEFLSGLGLLGGGGGRPPAPQPATQAPAPQVPAGIPGFPQLPQLPQAPVQSGPAVGSQLPNYEYIKPKQTLQGQQMCALLKNIQGNVGTSLKLQYGCGATGNTLIDLVTGQLPPGLAGVPSILSLFGGKVTETETVTLISQGAINPDRIPQSILTECISKRFDYPTCNKGFDTNINTATECFNIGCVFYKGQYNSRCFKCSLVPSSAYSFQDNADTCSVPSDEQEDCPGFKTIQLTTVLLDRQPTPAPTPSNPLSSLLGSNPQLSSLLGSLGGGSDISSLLSNPALASLLRSGAAGGQSGSPSVQYAPPSPRQSGSDQDLGFSSRTQTEPEARQLDLNQLLLSGLAGGGGGGSSSQLLSLLAGGGSSQSNLLSLLYGGDSGLSGGFGRVSEEGIRLLRSSCERKGCCWKRGGYLGGTCFQKGKTFPTGCLATPDSGTCGKSPYTDLTRIIGGTPVASNTHRPWVALIKFASSATLRCGGVLICSQWIATSASCLQKKEHATDSLLYVPNLDPASLQIWVGTTDPVDPDLLGSRVLIERIIVHPAFTYRQSYNDIALIKVRSVLYTTTKRPACLPGLSDGQPAGGSTIYFNGYGESFLGGQQSPLRELPLTVKTLTECQASYTDAVPLSGIFCAQATTGSDTCYGDGGSPAVKYDAEKDVFTVVGLNFGGSDNCDGSKPALFTDIAFFMPWIAQTTNGCCELPGSRPG